MPSPGDVSTICSAQGDDLAGESATSIPVKEELAHNALIVPAGRKDVG